MAVLTSPRVNQAIQQTVQEITGTEFKSRTRKQFGSKKCDKYIDFWCLKCKSCQVRPKGRSCHKAIMVTTVRAHCYPLARFLMYQLRPKISVSKQGHTTDCSEDHWYFVLELKGKRGKGCEWKILCNFSVAVLSPNLPAYLPGNYVRVLRSCSYNL